MKLLTSKPELNKSLIDIIERSHNTLKIVSPFINFGEHGRKWDNLIETLNKKESILEIYTRHKSINTIKGELKINENKIIPVDNLHAKMYINDDTILLSSMNLVFPSFKNSVEFGIVIQKDETGYTDVFDYCNKYIFIYNSKDILDDLSAHKINAKFENYFYLTLKKNDNPIVKCSIEKYRNNPRKLFFFFDLQKNTNHDFIEDIGKKHGIEIGWSTAKGRENYCFFSLEKFKYPEVSLIPIIKRSREKILGILVDIYNCLNEE